jgi:hypothetical protein
MKSLSRPNRILIRNPNAGDPYTPDRIMALTVLRLYLPDDADIVSAYREIQHSPANYIRACGRGEITPVPNSFQAQLSALMAEDDKKMRLYLASLYIGKLSHAISLSRPDASTPWRVSTDRLTYTQGGAAKRDGVLVQWPYNTPDQLLLHAPSLVRIYRGHAATNSLMNKLGRSIDLRRYLTMCVLAGDFVGGVHTPRVNLYYTKGGRVTVALSPSDDPMVYPFSFDFISFRTSRDTATKRRFHTYVDAPRPFEYRPMSDIQFVPSIKGLAVTRPLDALGEEFIQAACYGGLLPYIAIDRKDDGLFDVWGPNYDVDAPQPATLGCYREGISARVAACLPSCKVWWPVSAPGKRIFPAQPMVSIFRKQYVNCPELRERLDQLIRTYLVGGENGWRAFFKEAGQPIKKEELSAQTEA